MGAGTNQTEAHGASSNEASDSRLAKEQAQSVQENAVLTILNLTQSHDSDNDNDDVIQEDMDRHHQKEVKLLNASQVLVENQKKESILKKSLVHNVGEIQVGGPTPAMRDIKAAFRTKDDIETAAATDSVEDADAAGSSPSQERNVSASSKGTVSTLSTTTTSSSTQHSTTRRPGAVSVAGISVTSINDNDSNSYESSGDILVDEYDEEEASATTQTPQEPINAQDAPDQDGNDDNDDDLVQAYLVDEGATLPQSPTQPRDTVQAGEELVTEATLLHDDEEDEIRETQSNQLLLFHQQQQRQRRQRRVRWALILGVIVVSVVLATILSLNNRNGNKNNNGDPTNVGAANSVSAPAPSPFPSASPSVQPSGAPSVSMAPTQTCGLDLQIQCVDQTTGASCTSIPRLDSLCQDPPTRLGFRYTGEGCASSFNIQFSFECHEYANGAPAPNSQIPTQHPDRVFLLATDLNNDTITYVSGLVETGQDIFVSNTDLPPVEHLRIRIYNVTDETATDPDTILRAENLLEESSFRTKCQFDLFVGDRYGSVRLIEFQNAAQGFVSCISAAKVSLTASLPSVESDSVELTSLNIMTNREDVPYVNKTLDVLGKPVLPNSVSVVTTTPFSIVLDLCQEAFYEFCFDTTGRRAAGGSEGDGSVVDTCFSQGSFAFTAGIPPPPFGPTSAPTQSTCLG